MIRVLLADKNEVVRLGMKTLFDTMAPKFKVWEADNRASLLHHVVENSCNLVIVDPLFCPGASEALFRQIRRESPNVHLLAYTDLDERAHGVRLIRWGARGYVSKSSPASELLAAIDRVSAGKLHLSDVLAEEVALSAWGLKESAPHDLLSEREYQVFSMLVCGYTIKQMADILHLSSKTISTHKTRTMAKMHCANLSELIEYALSNGLKEQCESICKMS